MSEAFVVTGNNAAALFTLKLRRGEGMVLIAMNWKEGRPSEDFVGFAIQYREPGGEKLFALKNRIGFPDSHGNVDPAKLSSLQSPLQKFRWIHFPLSVEMPGRFHYVVTPVFMDANGKLTQGVAQEAEIELLGQTYPGKLNVAFTRGFVSSQAFVERYAAAGPIATLLPVKADAGLDFVPTHPKAQEALAWMGFEARHEILDVLDKAIEDQADVRFIAYDLNVPEIVERLEKLGPRLKVIVDDSGTHKKATSSESRAAQRLAASAGEANVRRQHMGSLQHNKTIVVDGPTVKAAVCGSTNFSWRGLYVQANNAVVVQGAEAIAPFAAAFDAYFESSKVADFGARPSARFTSLALPDIDIEVAFSPHAASNALLKKVAEDISATTSSLLYSLAFLYETKGPIRDAVTEVTKRDDIFVYGISDKKVGGLDLLKPDGNISPVRPSALVKNVPEPFASEPTGGSGTRMHHKFVVIDFDKPTARVYFGSYNFSDPADTENGENLLVSRDRKIVTAYMVEALQLFDHYHFRVIQEEAHEAHQRLLLKRPPRDGEAAWFADDYSEPHKIRDRELFA